MTRYEIDLLMLGVASWKEPAWEGRRQKFCEHMAPRQYGQSPLRAAWAWFNQGFQDCADVR